MLCFSPCRTHKAVPQVDPQQDVLFWSRPPLFDVELTADGGGSVFIPSFEDCDTAVGKVMDAVVNSVAGIPKLGTGRTSVSMFNTAASVAANIASGNAITTTKLTEESVVTAKEEVLRIMKVRRLH